MFRCPPNRINFTSEPKCSGWLAERQSQHFDAVFVPAGTPVAIHIERQLDIDHDPQGRRLDHGFSETTDNVRGLD